MHWQVVGIKFKLRPTAVNLTRKDRFVLLTSFAQRRGQVLGGPTPGADAKGAGRTQCTGHNGVQGVVVGVPDADG
jgi:hypothetical protein